MSILKQLKTREDENYQCHMWEQVLSEVISILEDVKQLPQNCFEQEGTESRGTWQLFLLLTAKFPPFSSGDDFFHEGGYFKNLNCSCISRVILTNL